MKNRRVDAVAEEIAQEKAGALGRAGAELTAALQALEAFETPADVPPHEREARRRPLLARAVRATLSYVVQREACGLRDAQYVFKQFRVPREVIVQLGRPM